MTRSFRRAMKKTIAQVLEVDEVSVEDLLITQNRRFLLSGVSVTYAVRVFDGTTSERLMALLESSILRGTFLASLSNNSGLLVESVELTSVHDDTPSTQGNPSGYSQEISSAKKGQSFTLMHENRLSAKLTYQYRRNRRRI